MLSEAVTAIGGLKTAVDVVKTLIKAKSEAERMAALGDLQSALIDIQQQTLELQAAMAELQDEAIQLRRSNRDLQENSSDLSRYQLTQFAETGTTAYRLKDEFKGPEEIEHHLCPSCYQKSEKSILQADGRQLFCQSCSLKIMIRNPRPINLNFR